MDVSTEARVALRQLVTGREEIKSTHTVEGCPGGPNNDRLELRLRSGKRIDVNAYSGGDIHVTLGHGSSS